jgi:hypothetical protein
MDKKPNEYEVGYRKPPLRTRFQTGQSGNPKGRPKRAKGFPTILDEQLGSTVEVGINGRATKISKREAVIAQQINKAALGDSRSPELLLLKLDLLERDWHKPGKSTGLDPATLERAKLLHKARPWVVAAREPGSHARIMG